MKKEFETEKLWKTMIENIHNNINKEKKISKYVKYVNWYRPFSDIQEQYVYSNIYNIEEERFEGER